MPNEHRASWQVPAVFRHDARTAVYAPRPRAIRTDGGRWWVGGSNGIASLDPERVASKRVGPESSWRSAPVEKERAHP